MICVILLVQFLGIESILNPVVQNNTNLPVEIPKFPWTHFKSANNGIKVIEDIQDAYSFWAKRSFNWNRVIGIRRNVIWNKNNFQQKLEQKKNKANHSLPEGLRLKTNRLPWLEQLKMHLQTQLSLLQKIRT